MELLVCAREECLVQTLPIITVAVQIEFQKLNQCLISTYFIQVVENVIMFDHKILL